jgi:hypothetical protein
MEVVIARCGLVCSKCGAFVKGKCKGCHSDKPMFKGCPIKKCTVEKNIPTCAACTDYKDLHDCRKLNNWISKIIGFFTKSDRIGKLRRIREGGLEKFISENQ